MNKALVLIDIQNDYFSEGNLPLNKQEEAAENAKLVLAHARNNNMAVFHVQHFSVDPAVPIFQPDTKGVEIHESVKPEGEEIIVKKNYPNSFRDTILLEELKKNEIEEIVICGSMSHMCVDTTTRAAFDLGYKVTLIEDACATMPLPFNDKVVAAEDVHAAYMAALSFPFASVLKAANYLK